MRSVALCAALTAIVMGCSTSHGALPPFAPTTSLHPMVAQNGGSPANRRTFAVTQSQGIAMQIAQGPDGAMWAANSKPLGLLRVSMKGVATLVQLPQDPPGALASGDDGRLYMTEPIGGGSYFISAYDPHTRILTAYPAYSPSNDQMLIGSGLVAAGGRMWYAEDSHIAAMDATGTVVEYPYPRLPGCCGLLALGSDGKVWFTDSPGIGNVDPKTGTTSYFDLPFEQPDASVWIAAGADGNMYAFEANYFQRINPRTNKMHAWGPFQTRFFGMTGGPDGNLYFAPGYPPALGEFDPRRGVMIYNFSPNGDGAGAVTVGRDGNIWSVMGGANWAIGAYILKELNVSPSALMLVVGKSATLHATYSGTSPLRARTSNPQIVRATGGASGSFVATAYGRGTADLTIHDAIGNSFVVHVTVLPL